MTRAEIEQKLRLSVLSIALAGSVGKEDDIRAAKNMLVKEVEKIAKAVQHEGCFCPHCNPQTEK